MKSEKAAIDFSSLYRKEDWWAVWIGFVILILGVFRCLPSLPKIDKWADIAESFPSGAGTVVPSILVFVFILVLTIIGVFFMGG
jgi:uncharacterized membrane protein YhaH (DUF805 family)